MPHPIARTAGAYARALAPAQPGLQLDRGGEDEECRARRWQNHSVMVSGSSWIPAAGLASPTRLDPWIPCAPDSSPDPQQPRTLARCRDRLAPRGLLSIKGHSGRTEAENHGTIQGLTPPEAVTGGAAGSQRCEVPSQFELDEARKRPRADGEATRRFGISSSPIDVGSDLGQDQGGRHDRSGPAQTLSVSRTIRRGGARPA